MDVPQPVLLALRLFVTLLVLDCVPQALEVAHPLEVTVAVGDLVAEAHTVTVPDTLADPVADKQRDVVGLTEGLSDADSETVEQPLLEYDAVSQAVALGDREEVAQPQLLALRLLVKLLLLESVPQALEVAHPLEVTVAVGDLVAEAHTVAVPDTLADPVADKQRDVVGLTEGLSDADAETVEQPLLEKDAVLQPLAVSVALLDTVAVLQLLPEYVPEPLSLLLPHPVALSDTVVVAQPLLQPL